MDARVVKSMGFDVYLRNEFMAWDERTKEGECFRQAQSTVQKVASMIGSRYVQVSGK